MLRPAQDDEQGVEGFAIFYSIAILVSTSHYLNNQFCKNPSFHFNILHLFLFIALGIFIWAINMLAHSIFPTQSTIPYLARNAAAALSVYLLIYGTILLLKKAKLPSGGLGLKLSKKALFNFLFGISIAIMVIAFLALSLYLFVPFHFITGPFKAADVLKESHSYFWGNFIEELLFRGYPLIILSQFAGWRKAVWIMAIPFGLFHLPGIGFNIEGLKMIITTATYSFVFSYAFILTGTLWTSIGVHVASNILLHAIFGLDGMNRALLVPVFEKKWPINYDPGIISFAAVAISMAILLYLLIIRYRSLQSHPQ